jgi:hypothetical protein
MKQNLTKFNPLAEDFGGFVHYTFTARVYILAPHSHIGERKRDAP